MGNQGSVPPSGVSGGRPARSPGGLESGDASHRQNSADFPPDADSSRVSNPFSPRSAGLSPGMMPDVSNGGGGGAQQLASPITSSVDPGATLDGKNDAPPRSQEALGIKPLPGRPPQLNHLASFDVNNSSVTPSGNGVSMGDVRPRMSVDEAKEFFQHVFNPTPGELECLASKFVDRREAFVYIGEFLSPFLKNDHKEKWFVDNVMLTALGRERWRPSRAETNNMTKQQEKQFVQMRRDCTDTLRERLLELSGVITHMVHASDDQSLRSLVRSYKQAKSKEAGEEGGTGDAEAPAGGQKNDDQKDNDTVGLVSSIYVARLRSTVNLSFDCYNLLADRIPTALLSSFPGEYFLNASPVVNGSATFDRLGIGDARRWNFFVTLRERVRLVRGLPKLGEGETDDGLNDSFSHAGSRRSSSGGATRANGGPGSAKVTIASVSQLYMAMRNLSLVVTTSCSSMVLKVLFRLAEAIRLRRHFQELRERAKSEHLSLDKLLREDPQLPDVITPYLGNATDDPEEWKRYVITEEMSLPVYTRLLVKRFRAETASKLKKLRQKYFNIFAYLEAVASEEESSDFDPARLLSATAFKIMFLVGGGQRSIEADDRRVPVGSRQSTDDVLLSRMLEVPVLNRICWVANMLGVPIMSHHSLPTQKEGGRPLSFVQADECVSVMRELFQAIGALPMGRQCPQHFREWMPLFPLYAVNTEGKRIMLYLYSALVSTIKPINITVQRDFVLASFAEALSKVPEFNKREVSGYLFNPEMTVGYDTKKSGLTTAKLAERNAARHSTTKQKSDTNKSRRSGSDTDSESGSSCSTLLDPEMNIDAFTCISPQAQLYMRCSNEATERRHKTAELTPFIQTEMYPSLSLLSSRRPDVSQNIVRVIPNLMPSEAVLIVRWLDGMAKVTFQPGDALLVMAERLPRSSSARYFSNPKAADEEKPQLGNSGALAPHPPLTGQPGRHRSPSVTINTTAALPNVPTTVSDSNYNSNAPSSPGSCATPRVSELHRNQQQLMHELLGTDEKLSKRFGARWTIERCVTVRSLKSKEFVLVVSCLDIPLTEPLRIITIGHQRSTLSAFYYLDDSNDNCWSNPRLVDGISWAPQSVKNNGHSSANSESDAGNSASHSLTTLSVTSLSGVHTPAPQVPFCRSEEELNSVFHSLGVLLSNAIANGVFFSVPLAPLAFSLFKKAVDTGDYSFKGFMWLEPGDGNLLSPSMVLNSAYEIVTMTDTEYYNFLKSRGLHKPENLVFPVKLSLAAEQARGREDSELWNSHQQSLAASRTETNSLSALNSAASDEWRRRKSLNMQYYLQTIREHNKTGTMFSNSNSNSGVTMPEEQNGTRGARQVNATSVGPPTPPDHRDIYRFLPSREEYVSLYLVNDLAWSSVVRGGDGDKTRGLWVQIARGVLTSPLAKSPLFSHCCSRVIREVLCVPNK